MLRSLQTNNSSTRKAWSDAYRAARSSSRSSLPISISLDMPLFFEALMLVVDTASALRHRRWLSRSIPELVSSSSASNSTEVARWVVPARSALYSLWNLRRSGGAS